MIYTIQVPPNTYDFENLRVLKEQLRMLKRSVPVNEALPPTPFNFVRAVFQQFEHDCSRLASIRIRPFEAHPGSLIFMGIQEDNNQVQLSVSALKKGYYTAA